jgi:APA family basic amino acid/polyamine antiporter
VSAPQGGFRRVLSTWDATMVVVGGIIGAGIFINPYIVARTLDSTTAVIVAWIAGGLIALAGAFAYAELGSVAPKAGGQYVYLRDAFHPLAGFLYGWALLFMIEGGAIAAVAQAFAQYLLRAIDSTAATTPIAVLAIVMVSAINYFGVRPGSRVLNVFVALKVLALLALIGAGLLLPEAAPGAAPIASSGSVTVMAFGAALVPIMFSYGGWQNANYVAGEMRDPVKQLPRALLVGTMVVVAVYVSVNGIYLKALGHQGLADTLTPAADTAGRIAGTTGQRLISLAIAVSTFGFLHLCVLAPTRVYWAMADDKLFFRQVATLHPKYGTPTLAIVLQSTWAILLTLTGRYEQLVGYVVAADWIFFGMSVAALFVYRKRMPLASRAPGTFATPGYPVVPALFVAAAAYVVISVAWSSPARTALGALLLATGIPAYLIWRRRA